MLTEVLELLLLEEEPPTNTLPPNLSFPSSFFTLFGGTFFHFEPGVFAASFFAAAPFFGVFFEAAFFAVFLPFSFFLSKSSSSKSSSFCV